MAIRNWIEIEEVTLMGESSPKYFVDLVTQVDNELPSKGGLMSFHTADKAAAYAFKFANEHKCRVINKTTLPKGVDYQLRGV